MISTKEKERLLQSYEPTLKFCQGERFLPIPVEPYLTFCRLMKKGRWSSADITNQWLSQKEHDLESVEAATEKLAKYGTGHYLQFISAREIPLSFWGYFAVVIFFLLFWMLVTEFSWDLKIVVILTTLALWYCRVNRAALKKIFSVFLIYALGISLVDALEVKMVTFPSASAWALGIVIFCGLVIFVIYLFGFGKESGYFHETATTPEMKRELARMHISTRFIFAVLTSGVMISLFANNSNPIVSILLLLTGVSLLLINIFLLPGFFLGLISAFLGIPPDSVVHAEQKHRKIVSLVRHKNNRAYQYYGRVIQEEKYIVIQYFYFYVFNDWRTAANGINQHEADWEMVAIYITNQKYQLGETPDPEYVALSAHVGGSKRRWDNVEKNGQHPVIYTAKGSHANYFRRGEQLILVEASKNKHALLARFFQEAHISSQQTVKRYMLQVNSEIKKIFGNFSPGVRLGGSASVYNPRYDNQIILTDFADGYGRMLGYPQEHEKDKFAYFLLEDELLPGWVDFKGAWGVDSIPGEEGPTGPRWEGENTERQRWGQPTSWLENLPEDFDILAGK